MKWFFQIRPVSQVETEITQRDQFSNDSVSLNETIVREAVQNSLDAGNDTGEQIKVSFRWLDQTDGLQGEYLRALLDEQPAHAAAAGLDVERINFQEPRALVIEDFGTKGLTGETSTIDDNNFSDFWRRHGKSHKSGRSRGRWGLGKLVYSTTSELGVFFGLTLRKDDPVAHLMGQSVLNLYEYRGKRYQPHSFFSDQSSPEERDNNLPIPVRDPQLVDEFRNHFLLERTTQSGLSIVIPFPDKSFDRDSMIKVAIENYFYPIVTGQLTLVFDDIEINRDNIRLLANNHDVGIYSNTEILFDFIEAATSQDPDRLLTLRGSWAEDKKLKHDDFGEDDLDHLKKQFAAGYICGIRLPLTLKRRTTPRRSEPVDTYITVFIQRSDELEEGLDLYVRGGLTLPGERKFRARRALGVMIADEYSICDFLGDAENPAHTQWNMTTEKLKKKYMNPQDSVRVIKNALVNLYDLLAEKEEEKDERALGNFFAMADPEDTGKTTGGGGEKHPRPPKPPPLPVPRTVMRINSHKDGFTVATIENAPEALFPARYQIRAAYDDGSSNPFKKYNTADFNTGKGGNISVRVARKGLEKLTRPGRVESASGNEIVVHIDKPPFVLEVTGFDRHRDLKVTCHKLKTDVDEPADAED